MKLSYTLSVLITIQQIVTAAQSLVLNNEPSSHSLQSKLIEKCCQVGKEKALESPKFNCKLSARDALLGGGGGGGHSNNHNHQHHHDGRISLNLAAESFLTRDPNFADQCELVLESCCMAHHRNKNCDSGKQLAKSGASCMDVELSKEATIATESFNDCCMSCSLGILAAKNAGQNETSTRLNLAARCKLLSPLASSLSGQLYEQTYMECCQENLPRISNALVEPGAPIDCSQSNPCSQRCISAGTYDSTSRRVSDQDRCECFAGFKLASDRVNCLDIDECKLGTHTCNKQSEVCDNIRGSFRCLARHNGARSLHFNELKDGLSSLSGVEEFHSLRLCPPGSKWNSEDRGCITVAGGENGPQRSASLFSLTGLHSMSNSRLIEHSR